jgi:hypothetical protein
MSTLISVGAIASRLLSPALKLYNHWRASQKPLLKPTLVPFDDPIMLRAFSVKLENVSDTKVRIDDIFVRIPEAAEFAIDWAELLIILGVPARDTWTRTRRHPINHTLDPGKQYACEIGIPPGFAITASRQSPVTISVSLTTLGERERYLVQDIKRHIQIPKKAKRT